MYKSYGSSFFECLAVNIQFLNVQNFREMDFENFEVPQEIKEKVAQRLKNSGSLKKISQKIKIGMTAAIHELRNPNSKSSLELQIIGPEKVEEREALQSIYQYLQEKGLDYTLSTLEQETGIQKVDSNTYDLVQLIEAAVGSDDDEFPEEED